MPSLTLICPTKKRTRHVRRRVPIWCRSGIDEVLIVDATSDPIQAAEIEEICRQNDAQYLRIAPSFRWIFDVGAHIGAFSVLAADRWPRSSILALEPHAENLGLLRTNLILNHCTRVTPLPRALAAQSGRRSLYPSRSNTGGHSLIGPARDSIEVEALSLRELLEAESVDRVGLMKMDCEGSEYEILNTLLTDLFDRIERLAIECHETEAMAVEEGISRLAELVRGNGFEVRQMAPPASRILLAEHRKSH